MLKAQLSAAHSSSKKDANYWKILNAAVALDIQKGHQHWTITQLAKKSGISRTLIYYYFGSSKITLLNDAVLIIGHELMGMSEERLEFWKNGKLAESFLLTRAHLMKNPALLYFYIYNRNLENELGYTIRSKEKLFLEKIIQFFPGLDPITYESLFALFLGIAWVDRISNEAVHRAFEIITKGYKTLPHSPT